MFVYIYIYIYIERERQRCFFCCEPSINFSRVKKCCRNFLGFSQIRCVCVCANNAVNHHNYLMLVIPICSMYGIFTYIWLRLMVNVGKFPYIPYTEHLGYDSLNPGLSMMIHRHRHDHRHRFQPSPTGMVASKRILLRYFCRVHILTF